MAAIGRFQKGDDIFHAKVVDGEIFRLKGDVFGSPSFEKKATPLKGVKTLVPVAPSKIIAVGLNYADHVRETGMQQPKEPLFCLKAPTSLIPDGAKIEIMERVGHKNILIFGLTAEEVAARRADGYNPRSIIEGSAELSQAVTAIASGVFSPDDKHRYAGLMGGIYDSDWFMLAADFDSYAQAQRQVDARWLDQRGWRAAAIRNIANVGWFSSDRTIGEYARDIWGVR